MNILSDRYEGPPFEGMYMQKQQPDGASQQSDLSINTPLGQASVTDGVRTFPCTTCGKGFARRSDLARHERIHSAVGINGAYESSLWRKTSHPFSDSSSLARHRRIHSGKRPYKCPFADCQKTFTRRTTLTRHQNHHSGTVEEAAAATARVLASRGPERQRTGSTGSVYSDSGSQLSISVGTPSPSERNISVSPPTDVPGMPTLNRRASNLSYHSTDSLPPHMRGGPQQPSPRTSPSASSPALSAYGGCTSNFHRRSLTSHPLLPVLEPPTYHEMRSGSGSPHLSSPCGGWQSPVHQGMPSPTGRDYSIYPEPPNMPLYHANSHFRRPESTEPDHYELKPRLSVSNGGGGGGVWPGSIS
ncbi:MAG: hypothetical protein Q9217_006986 [Psora testacea]